MVVRDSVLPPPGSLVGTRIGRNPTGRSVHPSVLPYASQGASVITITIAVPTVPKDGGYSIDATLGGDGIDDGNYNVYVGPLGSALDPICYSGVSGQGSIIAVASNQFSCISPVLPIGGPYAFTLVDVVSGADEVAQPGLTVIPHDIASGVLAYRGLLPITWLTGYRTLAQLDFPQV
jgi:hypothetical protein